MDKENQAILQSKSQNTHTSDFSQWRHSKTIIEAAIYFINPEKNGPLTKKKELEFYLSYILI
jgi:hypothetical protein